MNNAKKININISSLVDLKAELMRKQAEVQNTKEKINNATLSSKPKFINKNKNKRTKIYSEKVKNNDGGGGDDKNKMIELEDVSTLKKSRYMLEAKSRLYNKLKKYQANDTNQLYLVDFKNKSDSSEDEIHKEEDYSDENSDPDDDWVEYKDFFGRSRKCLRKDLPKMMEKDELIKREISNEPKTDNIDSKPKQMSFIPPEKEPEIEIMRKKWELQTEKLSFKSNIHYQDILFDEARAHGVGYYGFSENEEERLKQQENLAKLRRETEEKQKEFKEMKELKNKIEENRLKIARTRQRIRAGLPAEPDPCEQFKDDLKTSEGQTENMLVANESTENSIEVNKLENDSKQNSNSLQEIEDKIKAFGELLGKRSQWRELSQEEWVEKLRKDRLGEFAPNYADNFKKGGTLQSNSSNNNKLIVKEINRDDPLRIDYDGPEPTDRWESNDFHIENNSETDGGNVDVNKKSKPPNDDDESDIIEPLSPPTNTIMQDHVLAKIPLPQSECSEFQNLPVKADQAWNDENISAGLKYLREKFDKTHDS